MAERSTKFCFFGVLGCEGGQPFKVLVLGVWGLVASGSLDPISRNTRGIQRERERERESYTIRVLPLLYGFCIVILLLHITPMKVDSAKRRKRVPGSTGQADLTLNP